MIKNLQKKAEERFINLWKSEGPKLLEAQINSAIMKNNTTDPVSFCVSTIARLSLQPSGAKTITNIRKQLSILFCNASTQFIYPDESLHITLVGCTQRETSTENFTQTRIKKIAQICHPIIKKSQQINVRFKGIGIMGNQIFIQGIDLNSNLTKTRTDLISNLKKVGESPIDYPDKFPVHMNIIRITDTSKNKLRLLHKLIAQLRKVDLGIVEFSIIELVITDFVVSKNNLITFSKIKLN